MAIVTIIGAGNGAHALAADSKLGGAEEVRLCGFERYTNRIKGILKSREIQLKGLEKNPNNFSRQGKTILDMVTYDMKEAVSGADHILVSIQSQGAIDIYEELAPLLEDGQTVSIFPDNYGSLILRNIMRKKGLKTDVIIAGFGGLVYGARLTDFNNMNTHINVVDITYRENEIRVDTLPTTDFEDYLKIKHEIPALDASELIHAKTVLDASLSNLNPIVHIPAVLMNVGTIENWGIIPNLGSKDIYWDMYAYGTSPAVADVQYQFLKELEKIANAFNVEIGMIDREAFHSRMGPIGEFFYGEGFRQPFTEALDQTTWLPTPKGDRFTLESRYLTEDIPVGIGGALSFARIVGIETPLLDSLMYLGNIVTKTDNRKEGYNLEMMGLSGMDAESIINYLKYGHTVEGNDHE